MPYSQPTLAQTATALASRLNDPANVRWVLPELHGYIREALRWWNACTSHFRAQDGWSTVIGEPFYDLTLTLPSLRGQSVTNWQVIADLQYALLEPAAAGGTWTGTDQFTLDQLSTAVQRRRDQFLRETGAIVTRTLLAQFIVSPPIFSGRIDLDEAMLIVRRAAWRVTSTQTLLPLLRTDDWAANAYAPAWTTAAGRQRAYTTSVTPPLQLQIIDAPQADGTLDLLTINAGAPVVSATDLSLGIPDDFAWVVKFGALADLLQGDGLALDPHRAAYCEARWQEGLRLARTTPVVLAARIDDLPCTIGAVSDADVYSPTWQLVTGVPKKVLLSGQNLVAIWPPPGGTGGPWAITLDVVRNAPVPALTGDILQISQDVYDTILDYSQHLALFKEGPGQLELATALYDRAARAAGIDHRLQQATQPARVPLFGQQPQDRRGASPEQRDVPAAIAFVEAD